MSSYSNSLLKGPRTKPILRSIRSWSSNLAPGVRTTPRNRSWKSSSLIDIRPPADRNAESISNCVLGSVPVNPLSPRRQPPEPLRVRTRCTIRNDRIGQRVRCQRKESGNPSLFFRPRANFAFNPGNCTSFTCAALRRVSPRRAPERRCSEPAARPWKEHGRVVDGRLSARRLGLGRRNRTSPRGQHARQERARRGRFAGSAGAARLFA